MTLEFEKCESLELPVASILEVKQIRLSNVSKSMITRKLDVDYNQLILNLKSELIANKKSDSSLIKPTLNELVKVFYCHCDMSVLRDTSKNKTLFIYDPRIKLMDSSISYVEQLLGDISSQFVVNKSGDLVETQFEIVIDDIKKTTQQLVMKLKNNSTIRDFEKLPSNYIVTLNDKVLDLINRKSYDLSTINKYYDIVNRNQFNFTQNQLANKENAKTNLNQEIINRVIKDWSGNNVELENLLWQIIYAVLQNNNHDKIIILIGSGGNGKSTFMKLLRLIAGSENVIEANLHQFSDPNAINKINMSTKVVIGDDLATNCKIGSTTLSNIKSIVTGDPISVPVKYQDNTIIQTNALIIQATNTEPNLFENNAAMKSRLLVINWTNEDFRSKQTELTFNLDELMQDQSFIDDWVMMCLEKIEYFKHYDIPEIVKDATDEMIENNDTIKTFMDDIWYRINKFEKIPIKLLYVAYQKWIKDNNPKGGIMKIHTFTKELNKKSDEYGFKKISNSFRATFTSDEHVKFLKFRCGIEYDEIDLARQPYIRSLTSVTNEEIDKFMHLVHPLDHELTDDEYQIAILTSLKYKRRDLDAIYDLQLHL